MFLFYREDANLLTLEGQLLHDLQEDDTIHVDMDNYISRLHDILDRKTNLITALQDKITTVRSRLS